MGAIRTRAFSVKEKYLNPIHNMHDMNTAPLMLSPQRLLASEDVASTFISFYLSFCTLVVKGKVTVRCRSNTLHNALKISV